MRNYNEKSDFSFDIRERLGVITEKKNGWKKELNIVCWNGREPAKFDIRDWSQDHSHMGRGGTLYQEELQTLVELYQRYEEAVREFDAAERSRNQAAARSAGTREEDHGPMAAQNTPVPEEKRGQTVVQNLVQPAGHEEPAPAQGNTSSADCSRQERIQDEEGGKQECGAEAAAVENIPQDLPPEQAGLMQQTAVESAAAAQA